MFAIGETVYVNSVIFFNVHQGRIIGQEGRFYIVLVLSADGVDKHLLNDTVPLCEDELTKYPG